jgi:hypothetical protein
MQKMADDVLANNLFDPHVNLQTQQLCEGVPVSEGSLAIIAEAIAAEVLAKKHRARVIELGEQIAEQHAELLARLAAGPTDEMDATEDQIDQMMADGEPVIVHGTGWCAPSP